MKKSLLIILLFLSLASYAQGEANIWYFGNKAGLDFNSGSPVALTDGKMSTLEGCATISNSNGELLFYTDGKTVWDKLHQIMSNGTGLLGNSSSTQSAIIVPKPNSTTIYYIFTVDAVADPEGFRYSEVDMSLNGNLGGITSTKNVLLVTPVCEKIAAVKNAKGDGYWVVAHGYNNNSFLAYSVTANGVNLTPVISNIGSLISNTIGTMGYLKCSPDGSKLISCNAGFGLELFDFNNTTGIVTNRRLLNDYGGYGVEFSPSGNLMYVSSLSFTLLIQLDLTAANIPSSAITIYEKPDDYYSEYVAGLQLATNGKIYCNIIGKNYIGVIKNPNVLGMGCNFVKNEVSLGTGFSLYGLPQFIQSYFDVGINVQNNCLGETTSFSLSGNQQITSASWDFGDGNTSTDINPAHIYASAGTYTVSVTATSAAGTSTKTKDIIISAVPTATQPQDILVCDTNNDGIAIFNLSSQNTSILNGQDPNLYAVNYFVNNVAIANLDVYNNTVPYQQEIITAEVYNKLNNSCKSTTSFNIDVFDTPRPGITVPKISICDNTSVGTDTDGKILFDLSQRTTARVSLRAQHEQ